MHYWKTIKKINQRYNCQRTSVAGKNIINITSGNLQITMNEIKDLKAEVSDLKDSLKRTKNTIEKK